MRKIISLFQRDYHGNRLVRDEVTPGAGWVAAGEGEATRKFDGTCCLVRGDKLFKRYEVSKGGKAPADFEPAGEVDENTGKQQGWRPVGDGPEDRWHREAFEALENRLNGMTAELVGPKVQGNPERETHHMLLYHHLADPLHDCPRDFAGLKTYLAEKDIEGIVWHHPDGRMVKIKAKDFGIRRGLKCREAGV